MNDDRLGNEIEPGDRVQRVVIGATTVLSVGSARRRMLLNRLTGPPPEPMGTFTLVLVLNTRSVSSSGYP
jgi:hypothetical protein